MKREQQIKKEISEAGIMPKREMKSKDVRKALKKINAVKEKAASVDWSEIQIPFEAMDKEFSSYDFQAACMILGHPYSKAVAFANKLLKHKKISSDQKGTYTKLSAKL